MGTLDQKLQYLNETKNQIKQAIINKGQNIQDNDSFRSYVEKINNISLDTNALETDLLLSKTAYVKGQKITGTMPNNGDVTITPTTNVQNKTAGFYNSINIKAVTASIDTNIKAENIKSGISILGVAGTLQTGIDTSDATATAGDIVSGKTAYVKGQKITGGLQDSFPNEQINVVNAEPDTTPYPTYTHGIGSEYIEIRINSDKIYRKGLTLDLNSTGQLAEVIGLTQEGMFRKIVRLRYTFISQVI